MALAKTKYLEELLLNHVLRNVAYTPSTTVYLALLTADPGELGSQAAEITDPAYIRQPIIFGAPADDPVSGKVVASTGDIEFAQATADWGTVSHVMIMDAATAGSGLYYGPVTNPKAIATGDYIKVPAAELTVAED